MSILTACRYFSIAESDIYSLALDFDTRLTSSNSDIIYCEANVHVLWHKLRKARQIFVCAFEGVLDQDQFQALWVIVFLTGGLKAFVLRLGGCGCGKNAVA
jgi:hypothetical protein